MIIIPHEMAHQRAIHRLHRQWGGEVLEVILYLLPFMALLYLIFDMSFRAFDQGMLGQATRMAVRQGSLYWLDPDNYDISHPRRNPRIKESMIRSPINSYWDTILIRPGNTLAPESTTVEVATSGADLPFTGTAPNRIWVTDSTDPTLSVGDASVKVEVIYDHQSVGLGWWLGITGSDMRIHTSSELSTETKY